MMICLVRMSRLFGVTTSYFNLGTVTNERERLAEVIATGVASMEHQRIYGPRRSQGWAAQTLVAMRKFARYKSPASVAARMGFNPLVYLAHETGARSMTIDQLILYAIVFNVRPDRALTNEPLARLWSHDEGGWWRMQTADAFVQTQVMVDHAFDWLPANNCSRTALVLPVLRFLQGKWTLTKDHWQVPRSMLTVTSPVAGETLYAIAAGHHQATWVTIVDPTRVGKSSVHIDGKGNIYTHQDVPASNVVDPVHHRPSRRDEPYCVGASVARLNLN